MLFTEIAVQNLAGFAATTRLPLQPGLNALVARDADVVRLLRALLFPDVDDAQALAVGAGPHKAALTLQATDGQVFRVVRDFAAGRTLLRSDPLTRQPQRLADDPAELARLLRQAVGLPAEEVVRGHLLLGQRDLPSQQLLQRTSSPTRSLAAQLPPTSQVAAEVAPYSPDEARRRLPELRAELEKAERFEHAQDQLYALQNKLAELSKGTEALLELEQKVADLSQKLEAFQSLKDVTAGIEAKIKRFPEASARREGALAELAKKREEYQRTQVDEPDLAQLGRDQLVLGGVLGGVACMALAVSLGVDALWLANIAPLGVAAFGAWRWVGRVEEADRGKRRAADLQELEKRIHRQFEVETQPVYAAMKALAVSTPEEVLHKLEERDMIEARRVALLRELDQRRADPQMLALEQQRAVVERELRAREAVVNNMGFSRDVAVIRRELQLCDEALAGRASSGEPVDPLPQAIERTAQLLGAEPRAVLDAVRDRLGQYLAALTDRRFLALKVTGPAQIQVVAASGASGPLLGLPLTERDLIFVAVRLALAERGACALKLPLVVDEPSVLVDAPHRGLLVKMLKTLSQSTQVLVRALDAPPPGMVDHVARA